jgi:lipid-binding SYLF domain-containing protein
MKLRRKLLIAGVVAVGLLSGCSTAPKKTPEDHRQAILTMRDDTLAELFKLKDSARAEVEAAPGYAVFNSAGLKILVVGAGGGRGVVVDNRNGKNVFMNMAEIGVGLGLGIKDVRAVFVFHNAAALDDFIANGVTIGANVTAAAKLGDKGEAGSGELVVNDMSVYQITDKGLALEMMISGTKYWPDSGLN